MKNFAQIILKPENNRVKLRWSYKKKFYSTQTDFYIKGNGNKLPKSNKVLTSAILKTEEEERKLIKKKCIDENVNEVENKPSSRINELNIQMLSDNLHGQIFKDGNLSSSDNNILIKNSKKLLKQHGLWTNDIKLLEDVELDLPPLKGKNIEEHFWILGEEQSKPYRNLLLNFISKKLPKSPDKWLCQKGWTKYEKGKEPVQVQFPDEDALIVDVEVCVSVGNLPTLATAVSENAWYGWVNSDLAEGIDSLPTQFYTAEKLIPLGDKNKTKPAIVVGHNVSYDRSKIKEQYSFESNAVRFLDTMAIHTCIGGINKNQTKDLNETSIFNDSSEVFCLISLRDMYKLYCGQEISKTERDVFVKGSILDIKNDFENLMSYCSKDTIATFEILQKIFPIFLNRFPHPVTLAGMLEMSVAFLPVTSNWKKFILEADQTYEDLKNEMSLILSRKSDLACRLFHNDEFKKDLWLWDENWSIQNLKLTKKKVPNNNETNVKVTAKEDALNEKFQYLFDLGKILPKNKPFLPGYPMWYRKLCEKTDSNVHLTTSMLVTPKLLNLTWENFPLYHSKKHGWGILVADIFAENVNTLLPFEKLKEITLKSFDIPLDFYKTDNLNYKNCETKNKLVPPFYYKGNGIWCNHKMDDCCYFFKLPHKDGPLKNVGNPLSLNFTKIMASNFLCGSDGTAKKVIDISTKITYWRNNRDRIKNQMVVWMNENESNYPDLLNEDTSVGIIIPMVVVAGTVTRRAVERTWLTASKVSENRIGSELRALVQAPSGYHIVGADVDSQELWIAALLGDSTYAKVHGCTPLGWMTLQGTKSNESDMHSRTAKAIGISRDHAKILNYARIYGAGVKFAQKLLQQFNPLLNESDALKKATKIYQYTKGVKRFTVRPEISKFFQERFGCLEVNDMATAYQITKILNKKFGEIFSGSHWTRGTESHMFNKLEKIASALEPKTPFLSCRLSTALEPHYLNDDYHLNTRINWVVQSGAVDFLHLMLVCMRWLTNGHARYCFSFHDEIRYLFPSEQKYSGALAVHLTNLFVRSFCCHRLGIYDLPQSVAFFSSVEVDTILRKEAKDDCITPSNPHGMEKGYGIPPGESLNIYETIKKSGGSLSVFFKKSGRVETFKC